MPGIEADINQDINDVVVAHDNNLQARRETLQELVERSRIDFAQASNDLLKEATKAQYAQLFGHWEHFCKT